MKMTKEKCYALIALLLVAPLGGCYGTRSSSGGGQTDFSAPRRVDAKDVAVPRGFQVEVVATGLTFPTGVAFDQDGTAYVIEAGYSYGEMFTTPRLLRVNADGTTIEVARGAKNGPWTGVAYSGGHFIVAEGGQLEGGRILRIAPDGRTEALVEGLPSFGDHHANGPVIAEDGQIYFSVGTATNSGVVGKDNFDFGWLRRFPRFHDVPCQDVELAGYSFESTNVLPDQGGKVRTGAFVPYGVETRAGQIVKGQVPCSGAVFRVGPGGGPPQVVAWGFRNPFGLAFAPDGQLYLTENGYDDRGSRPIWGTGDVLWRVSAGGWYGWPDYTAGELVSDEHYRPPGKEAPKKLFTKDPGKPPRPVAVLGVHASANGFDFSRSERFGYLGQAFIAEFGDQAPTTGKVLHPVGFRVIRVDVTNGHIEQFVVNKGTANGPASKLGSAGLERPVAARFDPSGRALYIVDFGVLLEGPEGAKPQPGTGVVWRVTRQ